jgi:glycosyltransferase involved in cell wall biosynthesis
MNTCVIIPTFNESKSITELIGRLKQLSLDVLVIDDGSSDNTARLAENSGAIVLRNKENQGKGTCLIKGFDYALRHNYEAVITMDGDGQHRPEDIPNFLEAAQETNSAIIVGNRMQRTEGMPLVRLATNRFMSWLISLISRQKIPDTQCGFRLFKREVLEKISLTTSRYETESEILIKAARLGIKIHSLQIKTVYSKEASHINPCIDTLRFFRFIAREIWIS